MLLHTSTIAAATKFENAQWLNSCKSAALLNCKFACADSKQQAMQQILMLSTVSTAAAHFETSLAAPTSEMYC